MFKLYLIIFKFRLEYRINAYRKHTRKLHKLVSNTLCLFNLGIIIYLNKSIFKISPVDILLAGLISFIITYLIDFLYLLLTYKFNHDNYRSKAFSTYVSIYSHGYISEEDFTFILKKDKLY